VTLHFNISHYDTTTIKLALMSYLKRLLKMANKPEIRNTSNRLNVRQSGIQSIKII